MQDPSPDFERFSELPLTLQLEAIREGEERLRAQLEVATAADARALNLTAMLIAAATASLGVGVAFLTGNSPDYGIALVALGFTALTLRSARTASSAIVPTVFCLPGNSPAHWLPHNWDCSGNERRVVERGRKEQAEALADAIGRNAAQADERAGLVKEAFWQMGHAVWAAAMGTFALTAFRFAGVLGSQG